MLASAPGQSSVGFRMLTGEPMASQPPWTTEQGMTAFESSKWGREGMVGSALEKPCLGFRKSCVQPYAGNDSPGDKGKSLRLSESNLIFLRKRYTEKQYPLCDVLSISSYSIPSTPL